MIHILAAPGIVLALMNAAVEPPAEIIPPNPLEAVAPDLTNPETEILDVDEERNRRLTIPVMIGGSGPFNFMIDTGSQATAVTHEINQSLALTPRGTATVVGMASRRPVEIVELNQMTVGKYEVTDLVSPLLHREHVGADGIIGLDTLQDFRVLIDFRDETIALQDTRDSSSRRGFEIIVNANQKFGQLLITDAVVEGVRATVIIDTGAQASLANNALRERIRTKRAEEVTTTDVNGVTLTGQMSVIKSLTLGGLTMENVPLAFADTPAFDALGMRDKPVLSLGMQHLRIFDRVAIDFSRKRILFDVPRDVARALRRARRENRYGL